MVEVLKLFNNAGVPIKDRPYCPSLSDYQQVELLKVLIEKRWVELAHYRKYDYNINDYNYYYYAGRIDFKAHFEDNSFEETLAGLTNRLWYNLGSTDKERIRKVLGGM